MHDDDSDAAPGFLLAAQSKEKKTASSAILVQKVSKMHKIVDIVGGNLSKPMLETVYNRYKTSRRKRKEGAGRRRDGQKTGERRILGV